MSPSSDTLDRLGRAILATDHRIVAGPCLLILIAFFLRRISSGNKPSVVDAMRLVLGLLLVFSGIIVTCVFLLTKPPACDALSADLLTLVGLLTIIVTFGFGSRELVDLFSPPAAKE